MRSEPQVEHCAGGSTERISPTAQPVCDLEGEKRYISIKKAMAPQGSGNINECNTHGDNQ